LSFFFETREYACLYTRLFTHRVSAGKLNKTHVKMTYIIRVYASFGRLLLLYQLSWLLQLTVIKTYVTSLTSVRRCHLVWHRLSPPRSSSSSERRFSVS